MAVSIRPVQANEVEVARRLDAKIFGDLFTTLTGKEIVLPLREAEYFEHWQRTDPDGALVAEADGEIVGINFCHARGEIGWFGPLGVSTSAQGRGIGKELLKAGLVYLAGSGCDVIGLDTFAQNPVSVNMYLSFGFDILNAHVQLQAEPGAIPAPRLSGLDLTPVAHEDLDVLAARELSASGFDRRADFEFILGWEKAGGFKLTEGGELMGYALYLRKRGAGNIACLHVGGDGGADSVLALLSACGNALAGFGCESVNVLTTGENRRIIEPMLGCGFRAARTMIRMYRGLGGGCAGSYCPLASEKG